MKRCTPSTAKWVTKYSTGFIGTGKCLARREYWLDPKCPSCHHDNEDNIHILRCPDTSRRQLVIRSLNDLYEWMDFVRFPTQFVSEFKSINAAWLNNDNLSSVTITVSALQDQINIGWHHLLFGRTHKSITETLHQHFLSKGFKRHAQHTISLWIYKIWTTVVRPAWNSRNKIIHAIDANTHLSRMNKDLHSEITELYIGTNHDILQHRDRQLFDTSLPHLLNKHPTILRAWRDEVDIAVRIASTPVTTQDPNQQQLHFPPPPTQDQQQSQLNNDLTADQRRIQKRRHKNTIITPLSNSISTQPTTNDTSQTSSQTNPLPTPQRLVIPTHSYLHHTTTTQSSRTRPHNSSIPAAQPTHVPYALL